ncbi:hypothetical protein [Deinococcus malanensis]|uniref:hypothetical protein n=1 Tax=Deinococcus malanensis TaxID=1706855 RepID=UPI001E41D491|nr:hypothetical protein [Deinococcus malanensis]
MREYELPMPWRIPFAVTPASTFRELLGGGFQARLSTHLDTLASIMSGVDDEWVIEADTLEGNVVHRIQPVGPAPPGAARVFAQGLDVRLSNEQALEFGRRLKALMEEFEGMSSPEVPIWSFTALLTPSPRSR